MGFHRKQYYTSYCSNFFQNGFDIYLSDTRFCDDDLQFFQFFKRKKPHMMTSQVLSAAIFAVSDQSASETEEFQ